MILERLSTQIAKQLRNNGSQHSVGELSHGIEIMMLNFLNTSFLLALALILGCLKEVAIGCAVYSLLRNFTGGVHFRNPWSCMIVGNLLLFSIGWFTSHLQAIEPLVAWPIAAGLWGMAYFINYRHAPAPNMYFQFNAQQIQQNRRRVLGMLAFIGISAFSLGIIGYFPLLLTIGLTVFLQAILLHPLTFHIVKKIGC